MSTRRYVARTSHDITNIHRQRVSEVLNAILKKYLGIEVAAVAAHYMLTSPSSDISTTLLLPTS